MSRFAVLSDDSKLHQILSSAFGREYNVFRETSEESLSSRLSSGACDVVVIDLNGAYRQFDQRLAFAKRLSASQYTTIILADDSLRTVAADLVKAGAREYCRKPVSIRDLGIALNRACSGFSAVRQPTTSASPAVPNHGCDQMVGSSPQMREVYELIRKLTNINASVLVTGESGTGKELIAQALHNLGSHASQPFVAVSCGAIPETLIEAELFGHEKGAFTGTVGARAGYFEQAGEGTLFLDEIGELSPAVQVKLLRVLQQREFTRLGSSTPIPLRSRLVFATHADLGELVKDGKFRLDLYYRINVVKICLPSLQERVEDIPNLAMHFLSKYGESFGKRMDGIDPQAMSLLQSYSWPGNVRELENVIQRAVIMSPTETILPDDLPSHIQSESVYLESFESPNSFENQLRSFKIKLAESAIRDNNGNKTLAARSLNISRAYLHRLIRVSDTELVQQQAG